MPNQREGVTVENGAIKVFAVVVTGTRAASGFQPFPMPAAAVIGGAIVVRFV